MIHSALGLSLVAGAVVLSASSSTGDAIGITAKWIWRKQDSYTKYNDTIIARKAFDLPAVASAQLAITADTRYRLFINGAWVNDGPCRSWPDQYQYDVIDVTPHLKIGENEIRIIAKYFGVGTFHQIPKQAGLLAQLDVQTKDGKSIRVITDETWEAASASGWISNTVKRCIQMGPFEIYDARREDSNSFAPVAVLFDAESGPWKNLNPRDCALMTRIPFALASFREANVVNRDWQCYAFPTARLLYPGLIEANNKVSMASAVATIIEVPEALTVHIEAPGCTTTIDGKRAQDGAFALDPGKHFVFIAVTHYFGHWEKDTEIRFLEVSGYTLHNPMNGDTENPWCWAPFDEAKYVNNDYEYGLLDPAERNRVESTIRTAIDGHLENVNDTASFQAAFGDRIVSLSSKDDVMADVQWQFSARSVVGPATGFVERPEALIHDDDRATVVNPSSDGDVELVYDLGEENVGYFAFHIDAQAGLIVDVAAVEYIAPDGRVQHTDPYRNCMRYICKEGANEFLSYDRRAGRFVFITLRNQTKPASIRHFQLVESTYPVQPVGRFACSEPELDRIWEISARTLKLCMEDTYTDCPLFEQTHWVGDARNEGVFGLTAFGADDLARRCAWLTAQSVGKYPIALCQTPSCWGTLLPAWSFLWGISVWDYYEYSGDEAFLRQVWPYVMQNLRGSHDLRDESGLFSGPFWNMFDWSGIDDGHETVIHNSLFVVGAIDAAIKCADVVGDTDAKAWLAEYRKTTVNAVNATWVDERNAYPDSIHGDGSVSPKSSVHTSFLSYLYDVVEKRNEEHVLRNMTDPPEGMVQVGSPFAIMYLYEALEKAGRHDFVVDSIRENYSPMLAAGATTVWESFPTGTTGTGGFPTRSHCHAWSSAPVHFLNRIVLGIQPQGVGARTVVISPRPSGLTWAEGASATINGPVEVSWKIEGKTLTIAAKGPEGAVLRFEPNDALTNLNVSFNGKPVS
jgi:hypothetical protein